MEPSTFTRIIQIAATVVSLGAIAVLVVTEHYAAAVGVAIAGTLLVASTVMLDRRSELAGADGKRENRTPHNLRVVLRVGHVVAALGLLMIAIGALLAVGGAGGPDVATILLVWAGPFALVAAAGLYSAYAVQKGAHGTSVNA